MEVELLLLSHIVLCESSCIDNLLCLVDVDAVHLSSDLSLIGLNQSADIG